MPLSHTFQPGGFNRLRRWYQSLSLPARYALFLLVSLSLLWAGVGREILHLHVFAERESRHDVTNLSQAFAQEVSSTVGSIDLSLIALRSHWRIGPENFRDFLAVLSQSLEDKVVFQVAVTNAQGVMIYSSADPHSAPLDLSDREHIRAQLQAKRDRLFISKPVLGRVTQKWSVQFTRPIFDARGQFSGVIVASVEPSYFSRFYDQIYLGAQGVISVSREDGMVLARSARDGQDRGMGMALTQLPLHTAQDALSGEFRADSSIDGIARLYSWRRLPQYGLIVSVGQSERDTDERYAGQRSTYLAVGIGVSALLALVGWGMTKSGYRREQLLRQMAEAEARWKFALEGAGEGVWDWDLRAQRAYLSPRVRQLLDTDSDSLHCSQEALRAMAHPEEVRLINYTLRAHFDGMLSSYLLEHRVCRKDGSWIWVLSRGTVVERTADGKPLRMVGTFSDITQRKAREEQVRHLAQHDVLTGLPNRALLAERLRQAIREAQRNSGKLALIYFDLDRFKPVNDLHGHEVGDQLLKEVAQRTRSCLRQSDTVARLGGDEFVAVLPNIADEADALAIAGDILARLDMPFQIAGHALRISCSLGVASYPSDAEDDATLLRCADRAMYQAKQNGRARVWRYRKSSAAIDPALA
jgi:diguanylate cyclase (GGDEF)-like protein/PAS domain S-box-containing protein